MMVHCVSTGRVSGNHVEMEHTAEVLRTADRALCTAYMEKSGMTEREALEMMERETWLNAQQAVGRGLVDAVMFEETGAGEETPPADKSADGAREKTDRRKRACRGKRSKEKSGNEVKGVKEPHITVDSINCRGRRREGQRHELPGIFKTEKTADG